MRYADDGEGFAASDGGVTVHGSNWLHDLPTILAAAGIPYRLEDGWQDRSRSSGGYDRVLGIGTHHTASDTTPENDLAWMLHNSPDRPIGAMLLDRTGLVHVGAAGATNTQGKGGPVTGSLGVCPQDDGNRNLIAIEAANDGTGEPWPQAQTDCYVKLCAALCAAYNLDPSTDIWGHHGYCAPTQPGRKIDPAGPSVFAPAGGTWSDEVFRAAVVAATTTPTKDSPMFLVPPTRIYDTRGFGGPLPSDTYSVSAPASVPVDAAGLHVNVTVSDPDGAGFLSLWPGGDRPDVSALNWGADVQAICNATPVSLDGGQFLWWARVPCHVIVDLIGYYR